MDEKDWKALARIASTPDGQRLLAILSKRREECRDRLETADSHSMVCKAQGCADAYKTLAKDLEGAREVVNKRYGQ